MVGLPEAVQKDLVMCKMPHAAEKNANSLRFGLLEGSTDVCTCS